MCITGYNVYINHQICLQLKFNETAVGCVCAQILAENLKHLKLMQHQEVLLTVCTLAGPYESTNSDSVVISKELLTFVLEDGGTMLSEEEEENSHLSVSSQEEDREIHLSASKAMEEPDHVTICAEKTADENAETACSPHYYRALCMYDSSPNEECEEECEEELHFLEGDIILVN